MLKRYTVKGLGKGERQDQKAKDQKRLKVAARWLRLGLIGGRSLAWRPFLGSAGRASLGPIILLETSCDLGLDFGDFSLDLGDLVLST